MDARYLLSRKYSVSVGFLPLAPSFPTEQSSVSELLPLPPSTSTNPSLSISHSPLRLHSSVQPSPCTHPHPPPHSFLLPLPLPSSSPSPCPPSVTGTNTLPLTTTWGALTVLVKKQSWILRSSASFCIVSLEQWFSHFGYIRITWGAS